MPPGESTEYERGVAAGIVMQRLEAHDRHLGEINGSQRETVVELTKVNVKMTEMFLAIQRIEDRMIADRSLVATTADAVKAERDATAAALVSDRVTSEYRWTPFGRVVAAVIALAAVAAIVVSLYVASRHGK